MTDRLNPLDASFLYLEEPTTAMHVGSVMIFEPPPEGLEYDDLLALLSARIGQVSRYRQRIKELPGKLANPVWVDDTDFDLAYHVRRSALPRPGNREQLQEFVARIQSRPLDREHPLWEIYLVEGLDKDRFALVTKTHQALVDGVHAVDIAHLILDETPEYRPATVPAWTPRRSPSDLELVAEAALESLTKPSQLLEAVRGGATEMLVLGKRVAGVAGDVLATVARTAARPAPTSPLNVRVGATRRFVMVGSDLGDYRKVRENLDSNAEITVNDVVLATITGALRTWLQARGEPVHVGSTVRAMVPLSIYDLGDNIGLANRVAPCFVELPVGEPNARLRLEQVAYQMRSQVAGGIGADTLAGLTGFAPPTLHHLGARLGSAMSRRLFNLVITNVPGPQDPRYCAGAMMLASYPVMPLALGQAVAVGVTSYHGTMCFGLNGDRTGMHDLELLGQCLKDSLNELIDAS
ncbi:MAG: wax ester/triacylglycerol synthase family O-acyltransferase [Austwickia sp.]|nr:wax ester/triacylglycerol synthase family O-acyltransferase [Austwickia sp.]MBK8435877.1 wax ester/triacylglycerol synthase family O-acyltransferase [Austwickia sp.]MBK9101563.1 wax ester/triacylglycerol synthase family O-acyltransferase [Austwickia sp.]